MRLNLVEICFKLQINIHAIEILFKRDLLREGTYSVSDAIRKDSPWKLSMEGPTLTGTYSTEICPNQKQMMDSIMIVGIIDMPANQD